MPQWFAMSHYRLASVQICRKLSRPVCARFWARPRDEAPDLKALTHWPGYIQVIHTVWYGKCYNYHRARQSVMGALHRQEQQGPRWELWKFAYRSCLNQDLKGQHRHHKERKLSVRAHMQVLFMKEKGRTKPQVQQPWWCAPERPWSSGLV